MKGLIWADAGSKIDAGGKIYSIIFLILICILSLCAYAGAGFILNKVTEESHSIAVFLGFFAVPAVAFLILNKPILGEVKKGFLSGIFIYIPFLIWVCAYIPSNREFFKDFAAGVFDGNPSHFILWNLFTAMNVMPVDYFTKRIVQHEVESLFGAKIGFVAQLAVWCAGHVPEILELLAGIMGIWGAAIFVVASGATTGLVYWKTRNVFGMMVGHWILNLGVAVAVVA